MPIVEGNTVGRVVITGNITSMPEVAADAAHLTESISYDSMKNDSLNYYDDHYRDTLIRDGIENCKDFLM